VRRFSSFAALDALITVPFIVICIYSFFFGPDDPGRWFWWAFVGGLGVVMVPSIAYFIGKELPRSLAAGLICIYVLMLPVLFYGLVYKIHTGALNVSIYFVLIVAVAKSLYSACMVTRFP
jgi:hypothetical protein